MPGLYNFLLRFTKSDVKVTQLVRKVIILSDLTPFLGKNHGCMWRRLLGLATGICTPNFPM
jgi:hypothetical protein